MATDTREAMSLVGGRNVVRTNGPVASLSTGSEIVRIDEQIPERTRGKRGKPAIDRLPVSYAFLTKARLSLSDMR